MRRCPSPIPPTPRHEGSVQVSVRWAIELVALTDILCIVDDQD
jgi:hypothetical protein